MLGNKMCTKMRKRTGMNQNKSDKIAEKVIVSAAGPVSKLTETCLRRAGFQSLIQLPDAALSSGAPQPRYRQKLLAGIFLLGKSPPQRHFTSACRTEGLSSKITALYSGSVYNTALHRLFKKRHFSPFEEIG